MSKRMKIIGAVIGFAILVLLIVIVALAKKNIKSGGEWKVKQESVKSASVLSESVETESGLVASSSEAETPVGITQTDTGKKDEDTGKKESEITDNKNIQQQLETTEPVTTEEEKKQWEKELLEHDEEINKQIAAQEANEPQGNEEVIKEEAELENEIEAQDTDIPYDDDGNPIQPQTPEEDVTSTSGN